MSGLQGGLSWKAIAGIAVVFFVIAGVNFALFISDTDPNWWRWLLPIGWLALGVAQVFRARKRYVAEKRATTELESPDAG